MGCVICSNHKIDYNLIILIFKGDVLINFESPSSVPMCTHCGDLLTPRVGTSLMDAPMHRRSTWCHVDSNSSAFDQRCSAMHFPGTEFIECIRHSWQFQLERSSTFRVSWSHIATKGKAFTIAPLTSGDLPPLGAYFHRSECKQVILDVAILATTGMARLNWEGLPPL